MTEVEAHHERLHAPWSASATSSNWQCPGRMAMITLAPEGVETIHAAKGTATHTIAEQALRCGGDCAAYVGDSITTKAFSITIDEAMAETGQWYVDYINKVVGQDDLCTLVLEQHYSLAALDPPFEAGGTVDALIINPEEQLLEVVDLKSGRYVVDVFENKQTRTYALLALLNMPRETMRKINRIRSTIVQPNAPHEDGRIRSEEFHLADLIEWTGELTQAMRRSKAAFDAFEALDGSREALAAWQKQYLVAGSCSFCPAAGMCPSYKEAAMDITVGSSDLTVWFEDPDAPKPSVTQMLAMATPAQRGEVLRKLDMLEDWIKDIRVFEKNQADLGNPAEGYGLFETTGHRKWKADELTVCNALLALGVGHADTWNKKLKSPAQIEKVLGAKRKKEIADLWHQPVTGKALLPLEARPEEPMKGRLEQFFEQPEG